MTAATDATWAPTAAEAVALVADRLSDPDRTARIADRPDNREPVYGASMWGPVTLANGLPGVALLHAELAAGDQRWASVAHRQIARAGELLASNGANGLFAGPAALLAATLALEPNYARLRRDLARWVVADQNRRLDNCQARTAAGVSWAHYDVINGLSGTGRLLLEVEGGEAEAAVARTLRHLVDLTAPITVAGRTVPGWWVPKDLQPVAEDALTYPMGDFNLGMAHGVTGPLALLARALERGHEVPGQRDAIRRIAQWLLRWRLADETGPYWPCRVSWDEETGPRPASVFTRTAWCYGAPGVAAALHRAGTALDEPEWGLAARSALRAALDRDERSWLLDGPTVCHGFAGFLQVLRRVGAAAADPVLLAGADRLTERVLAFADPDAPFVFAHLVPDSPRGWREASGHRALDVAGLLEGAAGVACALLPAPDPDRWAWDSALLLS
ncbi:lanthionine synthetase C family protein [Actinokineospora iranica]|uniref:Lanthionine synthetase C-like protein n=1 Tax=Actinokineospora iranica TaxID=1271860 RepID=A0A1G6ME70_9PSEU|nr:lanthionine synthetase C family protein [Actinokineospora iranica]SDC53793.1 Lanthionine synthetase C-like protein [Actinokineospora iranica]